MVRAEHGFTDDLRRPKLRLLKHPAQLRCAKRKCLQKNCLRFRIFTKLRLLRAGYPLRMTLKMVPRLVTLVGFYSSMPQLGTRICVCMTSQLAGQSELLASRMNTGNQLQVLFFGATAFP